MSDLWFTSDSHFGHKGILLHRPQFGVNPGEDEPALVRETLQDMDEFMVEAWNARVKAQDTVWHLGDFALSNAEHAWQIFRALKGRKYLVRGNHDPNRVAQMGWEEVCDLKTLRHDGHHFELLHYPMLTWNRAHYGSWHLHGHSHGNLITPTSTRIDVGVDARPQKDLAPWHVDELVEILSQRTYLPEDHHA